jgi:hypothetical protein
VVGRESSRSAGGRIQAGRNHPYTVARYKSSIVDAKRYGLIKNTFDFEPWVDASFLNAVLKEENLDGFWKPLPPR